MDFPFSSPRRAASARDDEILIKLALGVEQLKRILARECLRDPESAARKTNSRKYSSMYKLQAGAQCLP
jgi:hypothetical protein